MNAFVIRCFNKSYEPIANLSRSSVSDFVAKNDIGLIESPYTGPMAKVDQALRVFNSTSADFVIYADVDVIFRPNSLLATEWLESHKAIHISADLCGFCAGFWVMRRTSLALKFLEAWNILGPSRDKPEGRCSDQETLQALCKRFRWIGDLFQPIPEELVSNPSSKLNGSIAHHFWANGGAEYWGKMEGFK